MRRFATPAKGWETASADAKNRQLCLPFLRFPLSDAVMLKIANGRRNYVAGLCNTLQLPSNLRKRA